MGACLNEAAMSHDKSVSQAAISVAPQTIFPSSVTTSSDPRPRGFADDR